MYIDVYSAYVYCIISFHFSQHIFALLKLCNPISPCSLYDHGPVADSPGAKEAQHEAAHSNPEIGTMEKWIEVLKDGIFTLQVDFHDFYKFWKLR